MLLNFIDRDAYVIGIINKHTITEVLELIKYLKQ